MHRLAIVIALGIQAAPAWAGKADVVAVEPHCNEARTVCKFSVTIEHADSGWEHYADTWDILAPDGRRLGTRVLRHPHVEEQPFTRSMRAIRIPDDIDRVTVRARDKLHGYGGVTIEVDLGAPSRGSRAQPKPGTEDSHASDAPGDPPSPGGAP